MARIEADPEHSLQLDIAGYQFPAGEKDESDANWLVIELAVTYGDRRWRAREAALLTYEITDLVNWLRQVAEGGQAREFDAIEPNLSFSARRDDGAISLFARFRLEFCRPALDYDQRVEGESLEFRLAAGDVKRFADDLETEARRFPWRPPSG